MPSPFSPRPPFGLPSGVAWVSAAAGPAADDLHAEEAKLVAAASERRRREFAAGRWCGRRALEALGLSPCPLPRGADRAPLWPQGVAGSISHSGELACAAATLSWGRLGVDVEDISREMTLDMERILFTDSELGSLAAAPGGRTGISRFMLFSGKEAAYKALGPWQPLVFDFSRLVIAPDWASGRFRAFLAEDGRDLGLEGWFGTDGARVFALAAGDAREEAG